MEQSSVLEKKYHDSVAKFYSKRRLRDYIWEVPEEALLLHKYLFKPRMNVVDMGCGPAISVSRILAKQLPVISYTGVDISRELLKIARKQIPSGKFVYGDMSSVKLPTYSYDILISLGALHHCKNKVATMNRWVSFIKQGGLILLREPIYEYLKKGTGESPIEEGIKVDDFLNYIHSHKLKVIKMTYFSTNAFHLFNRIMIKLGLRSWQNVRIFWYPVVIADTTLAKLSKLGHLFQPQAFTVILQKQ